ncbi:MAG: acyl-CoA thioesterase II [Pseudomonadales bacterium]|jgi:acyl-CoA thioesterase-2|nr:acyl-CoA thioesterase II [Pseudomonadales bacterium]
MHAALVELLDLLDLERIESDLFRGRNERSAMPRVFGGQVLAQALRAAALTAPERPPHSLHAYFLRPGDSARPILFEVERVRDGRSFATRRVRAIQAGEPIFAMSASFHVREGGLEHQAEPRAVPRPDALEDDVLVARRLQGQDANVMPWQTRERAFECRSVHPVGTPQPDSPLKPAWYRARAGIPAEAEEGALHECLLAYVSDMGLMSTSLVPHAASTPRSRIVGASLDHAMWFHRPLRVDQWLLYDRDSPTAAASRGFNRGAFFAEDGTLLASTAQESLIRVRRD